MEKRRSGEEEKGRRGEEEKRRRGEEEKWRSGEVIGFVLHIGGWESRQDAGGAVDWVRFAYLDRGPGWGRYKLGSFRINMGWRGTWYAGIGFVSRNGGVVWLVRR